MLSEISLSLLDRQFMVGDIVKFPLNSQEAAVIEDPAEAAMPDGETETYSEVVRLQGFPGNATDEQSGTVVRVEIKVNLEHVMSGRPLRSIDARDLERIHDFVTGDHVVLGDWFGVVREVFDQATVAFEDGSVCVINEPPDLIPVETVHEQSVFASTRLYPGLTVRADPEVWTQAGNWIHGSYNESLHKVGVVMDVGAYSVNVHWTVHNLLADDVGDSEEEMLPPPECILDVASLKVFRSAQEHSVFQIGDRVQFRNRQGDDDAAGANNCMLITRTSTVVDVLWQDSSLSKGVSACKLIPCRADDQEVWPMDFVVCKRSSGDTFSSGSETPRLGMIMAASSVDRTCIVSWLREDMSALGEREDLSIYEIRPHPEWVFRLGHLVLVTEAAKGMDTKTEWIGEVEDVALTGRIKVWFPLTGRHVELLPNQVLLLENTELALDSVSEDEARLRRELFELGIGETNEPPEIETRARGRRRGRQPGLGSGSNSTPNTEAASLEGNELETQTNWEPDDSVNRPRSPWDDSNILEFESASPYGDYREGEYLRVQVVVRDEDDEDEAVEGGGADGSAKPELGTHLFGLQPGGSSPLMPSDDPHGSDSEIENDGHLRVRIPHDRASDLSSDGSRWDLDSETSSLSESSGLLAIGRHFPRFVVVESAVPLDHKFVGHPPPSSSKLLAKRMRREFEMLSSGLPDGILVRSFDSRLDLLRALIVGPAHTPYQAALFLFDLHLPPNYPDEPPDVHFHSWTGGMGRLNPNLYESGRVCISLLGTWPGPPSERWSPASSVLQVLLSIQGLVLGVERPYFNEAGFDKLVGNMEDARNAANYSERAFLLSVQSMLHALQTPPEPFVKEVLGFFGDPMRNLDRIIARCEAIVRRSETENLGAQLASDDEPPGYDDRIEGGIVRTVSKGCLKLLKVQIEELRGYEEGLLSSGPGSGHEEGS